MRTLLGKIVVFLIVLGLGVRVVFYAVDLWRGLWGKTPNIIVVLVDALRADRLSCYGYGQTTSPALDALASRGVLFRRCYTQAQYTSASVASLFTGRYPLSHGYMNATYILEHDNTTMAETLREHGYRTAAFVSNSAVGKKYAMDQGFDRFVELFSETTAAPATAIFDSASVFIKGHHDRPFFIYIHFMDVHNPYDTPVTYTQTFANPALFAFDMRNNTLREMMTVQAFRGDEQYRPRLMSYFRDYSSVYDASISYWDERFSAFLGFLEKQGLADRTILIVTADHGEQLLDHGYTGHGTTVYDEVLRVPLLLYDPFRPELSGLTIGDPVRLIDIFPTVLSRLTIDDIPFGVDGTSLHPLMDARLRVNNAFVHTKGVYTEATWFANRPFSTLMQTYREGEWKLILDRLRDRKELYNLTDDPKEKNDLFEERPLTAQRLYERLSEHYNRNLQSFNRRQRSRSESEQEKLRELTALGYVNLPVSRTTETEYFPMKPMRLAKFGPFGDEDDLTSFSEYIDLTGSSPVVWGQIIQGCFLGGDRDTPGLWFDRHATFLLPNGKTKHSVSFDIALDPRGGDNNPTEINLLVNDKPVRAVPVDGPGRYRIEGDIPGTLVNEDYVYVGLRADRAFAIESGGSPGRDVYGSMKIQRVRLL
ncbi:MAG: sulfatase [Candidatus Latescibacteria bacterium]|nr:sulfatase [Candidatus Latescibacterota bacterium]